MEEIKYPRLHISQATHKRVKKIALKKGKSMKSLGDQIARAGLRSLGWK